MLTEQKPPCAAQFGVPNCCAHSPVSACIWSRPVKNASLRGSVARIAAGARSTIASASSHSISSNSPAPRSAPGLRRSGLRSFAGESCFMMPAEPFAHSTPRLTGCSGLPWMKRTLPFSSVHLDAAAARAHVAGRVRDLLRFARLARERSVLGGDRHRGCGPDGAIIPAAVAPRRIAPAWTNPPP